MEANYFTNETLSTLAACLDVTVDDLLSHCRKVELVNARSMIVAVMMEHAHVRQQDLAPLLDVSQPAVCKLFKRHRLMMKHPGGDPDYQQRYTDFELKIRINNQ